MNGIHGNPLCWWLGHDPGDPKSLEYPRFYVELPDNSIEVYCTRLGCGTLMATVGEAEPFEMPIPRICRAGHDWGWVYNPAVRRDEKQCKRRGCQHRDLQGTVYVTDSYGPIEMDQGGSGT